MKMNDKFIEIKKAINEQWFGESGKMDWHGLEDTLRKILKFTSDQKDNPTLDLIDECVAAFTKRGFERL